MFNSFKKGAPMRKNFVIALLLSVVSAAALANDVSSHSFFSIRTEFQSGMPERVSLWRDRAWAKEADGWGGAFQAVLFGGGSTKSSKLAKYFLPYGKSSLIFAEDAAAGLATNPNARDVNAYHFNIQTIGQDFMSSVTFSPRQSYVGLGLDYKQYLSWGCDCGDKRWWFEMSLPIVHVSNKITLSETIINQGVPGVDEEEGSDAFVNTSVVQSFSAGLPFFNGNLDGGVVTGSGFLFGKIAGARKRTAVADIELKLGYDYANEECYHADGYIGVVIPTGNKPKGEYVFEAIVGNNHHAGIMFGGSFGLQIWNCGERRVNLEFETNSRYLFRNTQTRSFDVINKQWSRYQLVFASAGDAASNIVTEGINLFTQRVHVSPRFTRDFNAALVYTSCAFQGELGYNFWARQAEKVSLRDPWVVGAAFVDVAGETPDPNVINRAVTIKENFGAAAQEYAAAATIQEQDLDLFSASNPAVLSHIIYGSLGYSWDDVCYPVFVGLGGSYEFGSVNTILNRWNVWGKIGFSI